MESFEAASRLDEALYGEEDSEGFSETSLSEVSSESTGRLDGKGVVRGAEVSSDINCGVVDDRGIRSFLVYSTYFEEMVDVYTAVNDPGGTQLFRPSLVAKKINCGTSPVGMFLHRHKNTMEGIFQALEFHYKPSKTSGLKAGAYFISERVCKALEAHFLTSSGARKRKSRSSKHLVKDSKTKKYSDGSEDSRIGSDGSGQGVSVYPPNARSLHPPTASPWQAAYFIPYYYATGHPPPSVSPISYAHPPHYPYFPPPWTLPLPIPAYYYPQVAYPGSTQESLSRQESALGLGPMGYGHLPLNAGQSRPLGVALGHPVNPPVYGILQSPLHANSQPFTSPYSAPVPPRTQGPAPFVPSGQSDRELATEPQLVAGDVQSSNVSGVAEQDGYAEKAPFRNLNSPTHRNSANLNLTVISELVSTESPRSSPSNNE